MARPVKWRRIAKMPTVLKFSPSDSSQSTGENSLKLEELESIRLKDLVGLEQEDCAKQMEVSRPTFQRILLSAREKIADSLVNGKSIQIEGGHFTRNICPVRCMDCGREWNESLENIERDSVRISVCPKCRSKRLLCCPDDGSERGDYCRRCCQKEPT